MSHSQTFRSERPSSETSDVVRQVRSFRNEWGGLSKIATNVGELLSDDLLMFCARSFYFGDVIDQRGLASYC